MGGGKIVNKLHMQAIRADELVWGDKLLVHKEMSLAKINYSIARMVASIISHRVEPFDCT